jgi:hypothetical protein
MDSIRLIVGLEHFAKVANSSWLMPKAFLQRSDDNGYFYCCIYAHKSIDIKSNMIHNES